MAALEIVRQGADMMPRSQINQVLDAELGPDWSSKLRSFNYEPMAAASIGQVSCAVMMHIFCYVHFHEFIVSLSDALCLFEKSNRSNITLFNLRNFCFALS